MTVVALLALTSCAPAEPGFFDRPTPSPRPTVERVAEIPATGLSTSNPAPLHESTPCVSVPTSTVVPAGFTDPPVANRPPGCVWLSPTNLVLTVSALSPRTMAEQVAEHRRDSTTLAHLERLRIAGHYAIERILATDPAGTCFLLVDVGAPKPLEIQIYRLDPTTSEAVVTPPRKAAEAFCPVGQEVALNLLPHLDGP